MAIFFGLVFSCMVVSLSREPSLTLTHTIIIRDRVVLGGYVVDIIICGIPVKSFVLCLKIKTICFGVYLPAFLT